MKGSKNLNIYPGKEKAFEFELQRLQKEKISVRNKKLIEKFNQYIFSTNSSSQRVGKLSSQMRRICSWLKDNIKCRKNLDMLSKEDMVALSSFIYQLSEIRKVTKADYIRVIKQFYKWFREEDARFLKGDPKAKAFYSYIDSLSSAFPREKIDPTTIITDADVKKAIDYGARTPKEVAFCDALHETGARIGEFLQIKIGHCSFEDTHGKIYLPHGKTGPRTVFINRSVASLRRYLDVHLDKNNKNSYLWLSESSNNRGAPLLHKGAQKLVDRVFERANMKKKHNLHWFRHSRASLLAPNMSESILCKYMGWSPGSKQVRRYVHLCVAQVEDAFLAMHGIKKDEATKEEPIVCICGTVNKPSERYCHKCYKPLTVQTVIQDKETVDSELNKSIQLMLEMAKDPEMMKAFQEFKNRMGNS